MVLVTHVSDSVSTIHLRTPCVHRRSISRE